MINEADSSSNSNNNQIFIAPKVHDKCCSLVIPVLFAAVSVHFIALYQNEYVYLILCHVRRE